MSNLAQAEPMIGEVVTGEPGWLDSAARELIARGYTVFRDVVPPSLPGRLMEQLHGLRRECLTPTAPGCLEAWDSAGFEALFDLLTLDCVTKTIARLFVGQGRLLSAAARIVDPGTAPQQMHRDYPTSWPIRRPDQTLWSVYPSLIVAYYPGGLTREMGPLMVVPRTHCDQIGDAELAPVPLLADPTDMVVLDAAVLHGCGGNTGTRSRYACFLDFAPSYVRRPRPIRPLDNPTESQTLLMGQWFEQR